MKTRITQLLGIEHPIFQAAMSWASSNSALIVAVSNAGGLGVLAGGPMRPEDFRRALREIKAGTDKPYGVNIPLNNPRAAERDDLFRRCLTKEEAEAFNSVLAKLTGQARELIDREKQQRARK